MRVAIIGAGPSGLASIKSCLEENLEPVCFEQQSSLGGLWKFSPDRNGHSSVYKSTVINTCKEMTCFSDFPAPEEFPMFMPHGDVLKYFHLYAKNFNLFPYMRFSTKVVRVEKSSDHSVTGKWLVQYQTSGQEEARTEVFDGVLVGSGHHWCPSWPSFQGIEKFTGTKIHSHSYKDQQGFEDKTVLVVGLGNSASEIATELTHHASKVYLSTRRGAWVKSRLTSRGEPWDLTFERRFYSLLPKAITRWMQKKEALGRFDHTKYGVLTAKSTPVVPFVVSDELPYRIANGSLAMKPNISRFTENGVVFENGDVVENLDAVIFCTGYQIEFPFLDEETISVRNNEVSLYKYIFPPEQEHPTLAFLGLVQGSGSMVPIVEIQARLAARVVSRACQLPSKDKMLQDIEAKKQMQSAYYGSKRFTLQVHSVGYKEEIAELIGCKPSLWKLLLTDPALGYRCLFGPCTPSHYRLMGPGAWTGAKHAIEHAQKRLFPVKDSSPSGTRESVTSECDKTVASYGFSSVCTSILDGVFDYLVTPVLGFLKNKLFPGK